MKGINLMSKEELLSKLRNILFEVDGSVAIAKMNRPKAMNALNSETLEDLAEIVKYVAGADDILGLIITGEGKAFVAGADIAQMRDYKAEEGRRYAAFAQGIFNELESLEKPVIAAVNGYALGGGCELSLSCDLRIASDKAQFGQPEVLLGVIPCFGGTQRLSRLIGVGRAKDLIFTGRYIKAEEALSMGLVNKVVPAEALLDEAKSMMLSITKMAPIAVRYSKIAINKGVNMDLMNALELEKDVAALSFATDDKDEGMCAFLEKRKPEFTNK